MSILGKLFGPSVCESCSEGRAEVATHLPNRRKVTVCGECKEELDGIFADPIHELRYEAMIDESKLTDSGVMGAGFGISKKAFGPIVSHRTSNELEESVTSNALYLDWTIAGVMWNFRFGFGDQDDLTEVELEPRRAFLNAFGPLRRRFGAPRNESPCSGPATLFLHSKLPPFVQGHMRTIWIFEASMLVLEETDLKTAKIQLYDKQAAPVVM
jgi:hypothetical protein